MLLLCAGSSHIVSAQTADTDIILDKGIWELRNNMIPDFHYRYDDYLQYAPAAVMVGIVHDISSLSLFSPLFYHAGENYARK